MGKFYGPIGFIESTETRPGVFIEKPVEYTYRGDVITRSVRSQNGLSVNDNLSVSNQISIIANPYVRKHFHQIKYVRWMGTAWEVTNVSEQYPRLVISLGGVYNGEVLAIDNLVVDADISFTADLFGKTVEDLQENIEVSSTDISGILNYIDDYTGFSEVPEEQEGYYLALRFTVPESPDVVITPSSSSLIVKQTEYSSIWVFRVSVPSIETIDVTVGKPGFEPYTKTYTLSGIELE